MNALENIKIALRSVRSNLLRAILTMVIIAFGIMALVGILTAIDSAIFSLNDNFSGLGANAFTIEPRGQDMGSNKRGRKAKRGEPITYKQAMAFKDRFDFPAEVSASVRCTRSATIAYGDEKTNPTVQVRAIDESYLDVKGFEIEKGRAFTKREVLNGANKVLIGSDVLKKLFKGKAEKALGKKVSIGNLQFRVVGVLKSKGTSMNQNDDRAVFIPLMDGKRYYASQRQNYNITVAVKDATRMEAAETATIGVFRGVRHLKSSEENDFELFSSDSLVSMIKENTTNFRVAAVAIGLMTLLGAAIGLMNIMLVSVTERTREVGICKALGATRKNILWQFLTEAIVICQLGGIFGTILGIFIGLGVTHMMGGTFRMPWNWIIMAIIVCTLVGLASGIWPAMKAARLDPIEALRHE
ncbi:MAG TPA: FtsX-like permease family protein [Bacteroidetes bacterium]|nr:FtsX-like permease family protein [Bacteroidota bacterium]